jgi:hypothetical protein
MHHTADTNIRPAPDRELVDIANYVLDHRIESEEAYETARLCLMDSLGCAMLALEYPECVRHLGPIVPGTAVPDGVRVPGTAHVLDPVKAAFRGHGEVEFLEVAMQPGKPQAFGTVAGRPYFGLPGNPVSVFVSFEVFVRPALRAMQGRRDTQRPRIRAEVAEPLTSPPDKRSYLRVRLAHDAGRWTATPTGGQGSHLVSSIALADGLAIVPEEVTEVPAGAQVDVQLLVD